MFEYLEFEKPIQKLHDQINDLKQVSQSGEVNVEDDIRSLSQKKATAY